MTIKEFSFKKYVAISCLAFFLMFASIPFYILKQYLPMALCLCSCIYLFYYTNEYYKTRPIAKAPEYPEPNQFVGAEVE